MTQSTRERTDAEVEQNKAVIRRFVEEVQNRKDPDVYDELNDPDFVNQSAPPGIPADRAGGKAYLWGFYSAFPDSHWSIDDMVAEGDRVVTKKTMTATHTGPLGELPASGRTVTIQYVDIMRPAGRQDRRALDVHGPAGVPPATGSGARPACLGRRPHGPARAGSRTPSTRSAPAGARRTMAPHPRGRGPVLLAAGG